MSPRRRHIKFSYCPLDYHNGEMWPKLKPVDFTKPVILEAVATAWSEDIAFGSITIPAVNHALVSFSWGGDTFQDFSMSHIRELLRKFYNRANVFGLILIFSQDGYYFSTFRAYEWRKHNWYESHIGNEFWIKHEVDA